MEKEKIESESKFIWKLLFHIIITPITFLLVMFGKKETSALFLPFRDIYKFVLEPKFTVTLIIINMIMYFISLTFSEDLSSFLINYTGDLFSWRFFSLFTSGFLHADIFHLLWNMLALFIFGRVVERKLGVGKTALVYFGALFISGIFSTIINLTIGNNVAGLGASGAIMGLVAAAMLLDPFYFTYELIIPMPVMVAGWIAIYSDLTGILSRIDDGIGHFAHLGGFLSITLIMFFLEGKEKQKLKRGFWINIISLAVLVLLYFLL